MDQIVTQTKVVRIGNSKGIVIPKNMLNILGDLVRLRIKDNKVLIEPVKEKVVPQEQWENIFAKHKADYDYADFVDFDSTLNDGLDD